MTNDDPLHNGPAGARVWVRASAERAAYMRIYANFRLENTLRTVRLAASASRVLQHSSAYLHRSNK